MDAMRREAQAGAAPAAKQQRACVHVVDDDPMVHAALARMLRAHGFVVTAHGSAQDFLDARDAEDPGCLVLDVSMPGLDGPALQRKLLDAGDTIPVVFVSGSASVGLCAAAMRLGAIDFLTKPVREEELVRAVSLALHQDAVRRAACEHRRLTESRLSTLTPREREVLGHVMDGRLNKQIAAELGTAETTVKVHRARAMEKMRVRSVAELVRMVERARSGVARSC